MGSATSGPVQTTWSAPSNIALIKYWGKRDALLNLPINSSMSMTLSSADLCAKTTVTLSPAFISDRLWLNGVEVKIEGNARVTAVLKELRKRAGGKTAVEAGEGVSAVPAISCDTIRTWCAHIVSRNSFPTAAGLASSAAGYAALVASLADALGVVEAYEGELSGVCRRGSGSASRSLSGGFVEWRMGSRIDGKDSIARPVAPRAHWPSIRVIIAVVSAKKKAVGSTDGMARSVETSALLRHRALNLVEPRLALAKKAVMACDFAGLAEMSMADSNQFHATCLDTFPPVFYLNDISRRIILLVHALNAAEGATVAGYTFDAGPNAVLFTDGPRAAALLLAALKAHFPSEAAGYVTGVALAEVDGLGLKDLHETLAPSDPLPGALSHIYATLLGDGAVKEAASLADATTGLPLDTTTDESLDTGL